MFFTNKFESSRVEGVLSDYARLTSVAYVGPKSRTERLGKTKIGTKVGHVTRDSGTTFKVKKVKGQLAGDGGILWRPPAQLVKLLSPHRRPTILVFSC